MPFTKLPADFKADNKAHVAVLAQALTMLNLLKQPETAAPPTQVINEPIKEAVQTFKQDNALGATDQVDAKTIESLNTALHDKFVASSKSRVSDVQQLLAKVAIPVDKTDVSNRVLGDSTRKAIETFQAQNNMPVDGKLSESVLTGLQNAAITATLTTKTQQGILLTTLQKVSKIAKLNVTITPQELKEKQLGDSAKQLITEFQKKYKLPPTGTVDKATLDKLHSVAVSKGVRVTALRTPQVKDIQVVTKELRLNKVAPAVKQVQKSLAFLGYKIADKEFQTHTFGKTTAASILAFQKAHGLAQTGHYDKPTAKLITKQIATANPQAVVPHRYRVRGSVKDELWRPKNNMVVKVFEWALDKEGQLLAAKRVFVNGFFDLPYNAPTNPVNGKIQDKFHVVVKLYDFNDQTKVLAEQIQLNVNPIRWVNFTATKNANGTITYDGKFLGASEYETTKAILQMAIAGKAIADLKETPDNRQISVLSTQTGLSTDEIMAHVLANLAAESVNTPLLTDEVFYAFIVQNLPPDLPGNLLLGTSDWETIDQLVELVTSGVVFLEEAIQQQSLLNAIAQNLVSQQINVNQTAILIALATKRQYFILTKPILIGNGNLKMLLDTASVAPTSQPVIAQAFIANKGINDSFWKTLEDPGSTVSASEVAGLTTVVEAGNITKNHLPTITYLQANVGDGPGKPFKKVSDVAKLDTAGIAALIDQNGKQVPDNIPGNTADEKVANYAAAIKARSQVLYPVQSFIGAIKRDVPAMLPKIGAVETFIDTHDDFKLRSQNVDQYLLQKNINLEQATKDQLKIVQRIQKLTPDATAGTTLINNNLHSSTQIYFMGKSQLTTLMKTTGVPDKTIACTYEVAKTQYMQILARLVDYRRDLNNNTPAAISPQTFAPEEIQQALGDIPNLELLFGSSDFCECEHCKSVYGPAAYLTDMLRFIGQHDSLIASETVKDILFDRRPDIGNIKLNCENTDTPVLYIDLACEILENNIDPAQKDFSNQTTLSAEDLLAVPEYIRPYAYQVLAEADFPMDSSFNMWQEETRAYLNFLRVPRFELMKAFQNKTDAANRIPTDATIAAEYFNSSAKENDLITTARPTVAEQDVYWHFDTSQASVSVSDILDRTKLAYSELLELLLVKFVNDPANNRSEIVRPVDTCDVSVQTVNNLSPEKFDLMHRFVRLWRKTGWAMWELDLLLRNTKIGANNLDANALVALQAVKQLQQKLNLSVEFLLAFYGEINREVRVKPDNATVLIQPLYTNLFQNPAITRPIDATFKALDATNVPIPIAAGISLDASNPGGYSPVPVILSALALSQADFDLLKPKTNSQLSVDSLSTLFRYKYLAQGLKLSSKDLQLLLLVTNAADPFASPDATIQLTKQVDAIKASGLSLLELDYVLNVSPDSPIGLRDETIIQFIDALRKILLSDEVNRDNQIKSHIAGLLGLTDEQAGFLLDTLTIGPKTLLAALNDLGLLAQKPDGTLVDITRGAFNDQFSAYLLLHKISVLVSKMKLNIDNLRWFVRNHAAVDTLNLSNLPLTAPVIPNEFDHWHNLQRFLGFAARFPEPEDVSIRTILDLAIDPTKPAGAIQSEIAKLTQWSVDELGDIVTGLGLRQGQVGPDQFLDYAAAELYERLLVCFAQLKLTGVTARTMVSWRVIDGNTDTDATTAQQTRQAVKSKFEQEDWLQKIKPLQDDLREKKCRALVAYHLENSQREQSPTVLVGGKTIPNPLYWKDTDALFRYFLIDVEMSACQLTSRIKQAISSVQLFVQRCFLNLENRFVQVMQDEKEDTSSANAWSQWKWMKNYRVWEANRKVFLYPENWIEPELRDDKSPFFVDLENELMQNDVTNENVEAAFQNFLHKMDDVSHLDVCGMYHQQEDLDPSEAGFEVDLVHVVGRTKAMPKVYYYRAYDMNYNTWSAWEKIDVDITGDHVVPVVYNRKVHLFWLQFMEKPMKAHKLPAAQPTTGPTDTPEPMKVMELQLAWSIKKSGGWSPKKTSVQKLIHPWERPHYAYNLKPYYVAKLNELYLDIYLSTSKEFNNGLFYDPDKLLNPNSTNLTGQNPTYLTKNRFNETYLPWHSSSFIFNGEVTDIKLKPLRGNYAFSKGNVSLTYTDSYAYVNDSIEFGKDGEAIRKLDPAREYGPRLKLPNGMHFEYNSLTNNKFNNANASQLRVLENGATVSLLSNGLSPFELIIAQQDLQLNTIANHPLFYQDNQRTFFIKPEWQNRLDNYGRIIGADRKYRFMPFYHPYTTLFIRELNRDGIDGILNRRIQTQPGSFAPANTFNFNSYAPTASTIVDASAQVDSVDFSFGGANSIYNWELFFHAPLMIACRLMQNQQFEDAMRWFQFIFDPTNIDPLPTPQRYWITKPFFEYNSDAYRTQRIESILSNSQQKANADQLTAWRNNPFKPHLIARYRPVAYQKTVVMKYLDNLIAWGDMLFKRDTIESINEASLLYMLANEILGERPKKVPTTQHYDKSFNDIEAQLDDFGNTKVDVIIEDTLLPITVVPPASTSTGTEPVPKLEIFYFCIPNNDNLNTYWDTVADRLFKIRNCMNIEGVVRQLPLFEPPIDPALLVKAAAAGIDLNSVLNDIAADSPNYRFRVSVQKAIEFCNEVKLLGEKLLTALEKKDAEHLSLLRSQHEIQLLEAVREVRQKQIDEAVETIGSLNKALDAAQENKDYYDGLVADGWNVGEKTAFSLSIASTVLDAAIAAGYIISGGLKIIPSFLAGAAGFGGSPTVNVTMGGQQIGNGAEMAVRTLQAIATALDKGAALASTTATYQRREDEWNHQARLATIQKDQIQFQINAAMIRQAIAEKELDNQDLQIDNAKAIDDYMQNKYTNEQLFTWMVTQLSTVYFQAYQLAFDMAKKAERCYQREVGLKTSNIVQFGYWDSLKKGLLSGDKLMTDLQRLEAEYLNQNKREFELIKHISLAQMFPKALITLKETGTCSISIPEWMFDMDYPGHYRRRIKNVSVSIPCIVGPYTGINCTLSLTKNDIRLDPTLLGGNVYEKAAADDLRFGTLFETISSISTSHGQNDSGMFELNFNDDRYLPFEGAGAISDWSINMPIENNYFDYASLSDVILHIQYTARSGGGPLADGARAQVQQVLPTGTARLFSLKHEFGNEWYRFLHPENSNDQEMVITLKPEHFPFFIRTRLNSLKIKALDIFVESSLAEDFKTNLKITSEAAVAGLTISEDPVFNNVHHLAPDLSMGSPSALGEVRFKLGADSTADFKSLLDNQLDNVFLLVQLGN